MFYGQVNDLDRVPFKGKVNSITPKVETCHLMDIVHLSTAPWENT